MGSSNTPYIAAIDWGTSSFRARIVGINGNVIETLSNGDGILVSKGHFSETLERNLASLDNYEIGLPIVMSGMIGSRNGWVEAPYTELPCSAQSLSLRLVRIEEYLPHQLYLIPGIKKTGDLSDVIRGEETEIIGAIEHLNLSRVMMVIPGTHSKVVTIDNGEISDFKTFLTGEIFHALCTSTILGSFGHNVDIRSEWFEKGVNNGLKTQHGGDLLNLLFTARSRVLVSDLPESASASFISGLLIGSEIGATDYQNRPVWIMGNGKLPQAYQRALSIADINCQIVPDNIVVAGTLSIFNRYKKEDL
ncbi:2-dehydro-3-deoxygalactonokinase [Photobacterium sp. ZSDE20]|uniref:2-dehydro-3-deoxygalactonokinase n=1 Tax=Photobacterium pectinilyticum TaxID=2906793 RepID=A0ABT1N654_9GAMM|nr:2-dehydro-3-deoxygalactonokinase [Photobacterium sp. ZSDE20]MCQ1060196.1 2-dehydro-3-deoxygalactonokinase [Photobacterium sp. ZSDE20]MDD1827643.1 2-dehydro-3-deoxygalactonokinase [Photobacterium sp. ZSDE20]